jgi:Ras-related protein Rab-1A
LFCVKDGFVYVYDCTDRDSFENISMWLKETEKFGPTEVTKLLCGNKADLENRKKVSFFVLILLI